MKNDPKKLLANGLQLAFYIAWAALVLFGQKLPGWVKIGTWALAIFFALRGILLFISKHRK